MSVYASPSVCVCMCVCVYAFMFVDGGSSCFVTERPGSVSVSVDRCIRQLPPCVVGWRGRAPHPLGWRGGVERADIPVHLLVRRPLPASQIYPIPDQ